jgi:hypothetical protein
MIVIKLFNTNLIGVSIVVMRLINGYKFETGRRQGIDKATSR